MDGGKCILQLRGVRPFLSDKFDITKHKNYRYLSDANPKNTFDIAKFVNKKLKVKDDEEYEYMDYARTPEEMPEEAFADFEQDVEDSGSESDSELDFEPDLEPV